MFKKQEVNRDKMIKAGCKDAQDGCDIPEEYCNPRCESYIKIIPEEYYCL